MDFVVGLTALDVAFITAVAAAAAAIAAPISAWVVARANNKHDRWAKTYSDLHTAYSALLQDIITVRAMIQRLAQVYESGDESISKTGAPPVDEATRIQHRAAVSVLASARVKRALADWDTGWRQHVTPVLADLRDMADSGEEDSHQIAATLRRSLEAIEQPWLRLCDEIRADLRNQ